MNFVGRRVRRCCNRNQHCIAANARLSRPPAARRRLTLAGAAGGGNNGGNRVPFTAPGPGRRPGGRGGRWKLLLLVAGGAAASIVSDSLYKPGQRTASGTVSVIIPALNEEACITKVVQAALGLVPPPLEVIVVDGGSSDRTAGLAASAGARVLTSDRGRAKQMNRGARSAAGDYLAFLHADTLPPADLVAVVRHELSRATTVLLGFRPVIRGTRGTLHFFSTNNLLKTYYGPLLMRPLAFVRGLRCLFGDQLLCCRRADLAAVGGYNESLPIMEDADLCVRLHEAGPSSALHPTRGRLKLVLNRTAVSSGRRLEAWGEAHATWVHLCIGLSWYFERDPQKLHRLYKSMYTDNFR